MPRIERDIVIDAPIERVFDVIADYQRYPEFLPDMKAVTVHSRHDDGVLIAEFELELIMRISYTLRLTEDRPHRVRWALESAKMMTQNDGGWTLGSTDDGHTRAVYDLDVTLRGLIPRSVSDRLVGQTLPQTLGRFKARAEALEAS